MEVQNIINLEPGELLDKAYQLKADGYRLVQINCTMKEGFEINYSFDKDLELLNLRLNITPETEITSISGIFWPAFLYENEMKELFGVDVKHMNIDFGGNLYKIAVKTPFNTDKE